MKFALGIPTDNLALADASEDRLESNVGVPSKRHVYPIVFLKPSRKPSLSARAPDRLFPHVGFVAEEFGDVAMLELQTAPSMRAQVNQFVYDVHGSFPAHGVCYLAKPLLQSREATGSRSLKISVKIMNHTRLRMLSEWLL